MDIRNRERGLRALAAVLLLILGVYQAAATGIFIQRIRNPENHPILGVSIGSPWPSVVAVSPAAAEAGLRIGDRLLTVQDVRFHGHATIDRALEKMFPGDRIRLTVHAAGAPAREVSWQLDSADGSFRLSRAIYLTLTSIAMPLLCLAVGFWTVFARPRDPQAWVLLGMLTSFGQEVVNPGAFHTSLGGIATFFHVLHIGVGSGWAPFMFLFAWIFPLRTPWQLRNAKVAWGVELTLIGATGALAVREGLTKWAHPADWGGPIDALDSWSVAVRVIQMLGISGFFALTAYKMSTLEDAGSRRRLKTIYLGATVALAPLFLVVLWGLAVGKAPGDMPEYVLVPAVIALCFFPLTLGFVIVVHRAFGLGLVFRQGLQYAVARRGARILQALLILGVILAAVLMATQPGMNRPRTLQVVAAGTLVVVWLQVAGERLAGWVDRRFFRESYNAEVVLASLSDDVRTMVETKPLLEAVATRIGQALHVDRIAVLLHEGSGFQPAYAIGAAGNYGAGLPDDSHTAALMRRERTPLRVYLDDSNSWIYREGLEPKETAWLAAMGAELLVPLTVKDRLLGILTMGGKRSEEPYSGNDLRLLQNVAVQTGLALENSHLAAAVTEAVAQRERLNREVEIAQEVQQMLFPQKLPAIEGLEYGGFCRPARGVGGDSYDFLLLDSGIFAISIGDVSGKGIPAALLMASLQSALRGQAVSMPTDLGTMIGSLNRVIFDSSPSNRYATLFYSQYDPATRLLTYVNGGHCPPIVLRGDRILRLEDGGPVVGLFRVAHYDQGTFQVERGDLLVGFTDGISEAMNADDDEWGEEALGEFLRGKAGVLSAELIPKIVAAADAFAAGAPQHDDMTLIVVRFL